jgi:hypothetical protein
VVPGFVNSVRDQANWGVLKFSSITANFETFALLHEMVPVAATMAFLYNPANPNSTETVLKELAEAGSHLGVRLLIRKPPTQTRSSMPSRPSPSNAAARSSWRRYVLHGPTHPDRRAGGSLSGPCILLSARVH